MNDLADPIHFSSRTIFFRTDPGHNTQFGYQEPWGSLITYTIGRMDQLPWKNVWPYIVPCRPDRRRSKPPTPMAVITSSLSAPLLLPPCIAARPFSYCCS